MAPAGTMSSVLSVLASTSITLSGFHMYPKPCDTFRVGCSASGVPMVSTRTKMMMAVMSKIGMLILLNHSIPLLTPRYSR